MVFRDHIVQVIGPKSKWNSPHRDDNETADGLMSKVKFGMRWGNVHRWRWQLFESSRLREPRK